ncbi:MAG: trimeric intracellular cation channel family protein [Bacteroidota bacterium]
MDFIYALNLFGTFVFAISGVLTATEKRFDAIGAITIGFVTSLGGGTLRDVLIGATPVGWMEDLNYLLMGIAAVIVCFFFRKYIVRWRRSFFLFDTLGIGLFSILGLQKTLEVGLSPMIAVIMGVVSAVFGGVIRDVLTNEIPLIFRKEIYATACIAGSCVYLLMEAWSSGIYLNVSVSVGVVIAVRILAVRFGWGLPFRPM